MECYLKPDRLDLDTSDSDDKWHLWRKLSEGFLAAVFKHTLSGTEKFTLLLYHVSTPIYRNLSECENYETVVEILEAMSIKKK